MDNKPSTENGSDRDSDSFEDAPDSTVRRDSSSRTRSLTRRDSTSSDRTRSLTRRESGITTTTNESRDPEMRHPLSNGDTEGEEQQDQKSPNLTAHRISVHSMDDVSLEEDASKGHSQSSSTSSAPALPPKVPLRTSTGSTQGLSGTLPVNNFPPPPPPPERHVAPTPQPLPSRKLTSPFSWLSRATGSERKVSSPPLPPAPSNDRRNTQSSLATIGSNPELTLSKISNGDESDAPSSQRTSGRDSLRDRFKLVRMREEAGIDSEALGGTENGALAGLIGRSASVGLGIGGPMSVSDDKEEGAPHMARGASSPGPMSPSLGRQTTINPNLAPGTVSGIAASESAGPVDWDLWQSVVYEGPAAVARTSPEELNQAIASGIPQAIRGVVWQVLAQSKNEELEGVYKELVVRGTAKEQSKYNIKPISRHESSSHFGGATKEKESIKSSASSIHSDYSTPATTATNGTTNAANSPPLDAAERAKKAREDSAALAKLEKVIKRDLGARTSYSKYVMAAGLQDGLFGVCKAYALFDQEVGYAQGMNFIAMPLLFNMPEEEAFCLMVRLMNKYGLREMFIQDMPGLHLHLYQFERLLEEFDPALYCHLHRRGVSPQLYATQWFLTLFAYRFPLQLVLRIYDLILSEGLEGAILKFGIVLMQKNAQTLLGMKDMAALTTFLKERLFDVYIDKAPSASSILDSGFFGSAGGVDKEVYRADMLVQDACAIKITPEMLKAYTAEWKEKQRLEKEREIELDSLKQLVTSLTQKVRTLEERAEKSDTEHVQLASELVKIKVENENLSDDNEALKSKVEEMQKIVDTQAEEVHARLQGEMETVMTRNIEVHNENRALEEQLQDMERVLVETKLQYAQINSEHETLKQKWNSVTAMMKSP